MSDKSYVKHEFDLHIEYLTNTSKDFVDHTSKVAGFLLLGLGWLATSSGAQRFLASNFKIANLAALAVAVTYFLSAIASLIQYRATRESYDRLVKLNYLPKSAFSARKLGLATFAICVGGTAVLAGLVVLSLLSLKGVIIPPSP